MAGGGAGTGNGSEVFNGAQAPDSTMSDNFGGAPSSAPSYTQAASDYYASLTQPATNTLNQAYQQALGRAPDAAGANYWSNIAQQQGLNSQQLASLINESAAAERGTTGYQSQFNPASYSSQGNVGNRPSFYNTNPYRVNYANIFNPNAESVLSERPRMTQSQQAQYLSNWQNDYSNRLNAGITGARQQRVANAQKAQEDYNTKRAQAEAQAAAANQEAINRAVQEALAQQQAYSNNNNNYNYYSGNTGGLASLAKGFKK